MEVSVIYAGFPPYEVYLDVSEQATVAWAIRQSDLLKQHPQWVLSALSVGIWGVKVALDTPLTPGDRVEVYQPLVIDPKEARRRR